MPQVKTIFVTVGTNKFDELIEVVLRKDFLGVAKSKGYSQILVQKGRGAFSPPKAGRLNGLHIELFDYKANLASFVQSADLVISHAGAGSIFEGLCSGKPMIVVPNPEMMHNHQIEIAEQMVNMQHVMYATPSNLVQVLQDFHPGQLKPFPSRTADRVASFISSELGLISSSAA